MLTWAGLLLLVLYSPIGSPDLYSGNKYYMPAKGVRFGGRSISAYKSSPVKGTGKQITAKNDKPIDKTDKISIKNNNNNKRRSSGGSSGNSEIDINMQNKTSDKASYNVVSNDESSGTGNSGSYSVSLSNGEVHSQSNGGGGGGGFSGGFMFTGKSGKDKNTVPQTGDLLALSSSLSLLVDNPANKEGASQGLTGTTDPAGDPTGDPIPVGEGWYLLLIFVAVYTVIKMKIFRTK